MGRKPAHPTSLSRPMRSPLAFVSSTWLFLALDALCGMIKLLTDRLTLAMLNLTDAVLDEIEP